jgi:hypothetical protein
MQPSRHRKPLDDIENQIEQSRKKRLEFEKTAKLLRLVNRDKERSLG